MWEGRVREARGSSTSSVVRLGNGTLGPAKRRAGIAGRGVSKNDFTHKGPPPFPFSPGSLSTPPGRGHGSGTAAAPVMSVTAVTPATPARDRYGQGHARHGARAVASLSRPQQGPVARVYVRTRLLGNPPPPSLLRRLRPPARYRCGVLCSRRPVRPRRVGGARVAMLV